MKYFDVMRKIVVLTTGLFLTVCMLDAYKVQAAGRVDLDATVSITAQVGKEDSSAFAKSYNGTVDIDLYKIGNLDQVGTPLLAGDYKDSGIDFQVFKNSPKVADIEKNIVEPAVKAVSGKQADFTICASRNGDSFAGTAKIPSGAGIYLYIPRPVKDQEHSYSFVPYIIFAPTSDFIASGNAAGDDTWKYDVTFIIKPEETPTEVPIPDSPVPTHKDPENNPAPSNEVVGEGEDEIVMLSEEPVPLSHEAKNPKTGDLVWPIIILSITFLIGAGMIVWYICVTKKAKNKTN